MANSIRAAATTTIDRDVEAVYDYVADLSTMDDWVTGVDKTRLVSGDPDAVGAVYEYDYTYGGSTQPMTVEVTALERPNRIAMRALDGPFPFEGELALEATSDGRTRVTNTIQPGADGTFTRVTFTLFAPVMRWLMRRRLAAELDELDAILESSRGDRATDAPVRGQ